MSTATATQEGFSRHLATVRSAVSFLATAAVLYLGVHILYSAGLGVAPSKLTTALILGGYLLMGAVHELGHAFVGTRLGLTFVRFSVRLMSLSVTMDGVRTNGKQFLISLAGPLAHAAAAALFIVVASLTPAESTLHGTFLLLGYLGLLEAAGSLLVPLRRADGVKLVRTGYHCVRGKGSETFVP